MEVVRSVVLRCEPSRAWEVLTDWESQAAWMRDADRVSVVSATREGVGVRLSVRTRLFGVPLFTEPMVVTSWDPPRRLTVAHGGPLAGEGTWSLEPVAAGTRFTWAERVRLRVPVIGEVAAWCYRPVLAWLMGRGQRDLLARVGG